MMASNYCLHGPTAPVFTPMSDDGTIRPEVIPTYVNHLMKNGVFSIFVNGTSGEFYNLTLAERKELAQVWVEACCGHFEIVIQVGASCLADTQELAKHAAELRVDAIAVVTPAYMPPTTVPALVEYVKAVSMSAPHLPLFYYHIPMFSRCPVDVVAFLEAAAPQIPKLAGIKFTDNDRVAMKRCAEVDGGRLQVMCGSDICYLHGLELGQTGAILGSVNYMPNVFLRLKRAYKNKEETAVALEFLRISRICELLQIYDPTCILPVLKELGNESGLDLGPPRLPLLRLHTDKREKLKEELKTIGFYEWK